MNALIASGLIAGLRGRSVQAVAFLGFLLVGAAYLTGSFSPRQPQTVALDVGFSFLRITLVFLVLFWTQELITKEIERKTILFTLSYPIARWKYILARFFTIAGLNLCSALVFAGLLWGAALLAANDYQQQFPVNLGLKFWLTIGGLYLDSMIVAAFALWVASISTTSIMPLASGILFAICGKSLGAAIAYIEAGADGDAVLTQRFQPLLSSIQYIVPDLSRLDWRFAALYNTPIPHSSIIMASAMGIFYIMLLLLLTSMMFRRREMF